MTGKSSTDCRRSRRADARLFILGSLPGDASLAARRYYAHPQNHFWRLLGGAIGEDLAGLDYEARLQRLAARRIGLWDVIGSARRSGSLDQAIRGAGHNPLADYFAGFADLEAIAFNGAAAAAIGRRLLGGSAADADRPAVVEPGQHPRLRRQGRGLAGSRTIRLIGVAPAAY